MRLSDYKRYIGTALLAVLFGNCWNFQMYSTKRKDMIAVHYDHEVEQISFGQSMAIKVAFKVAKTLKKLPWLLALVPLLAVGFTYTLFIYLPLLWSRRAVSRMTSKLLTEIPNMEIRNAMEIHADIVHVRKELEKYMDIDVYVFRPIVLEIKRTVHQFKQAEEALEFKAYPNARQITFTPNQEKELIATFKHWDDDEKASES